ncbi:MAG: glycosyltransferase family 39 protein [Clostridia bacterium]|nr:glycosyltransferase family 39 protein [Clostridia bacterium]
MVRIKIEKLSKIIILFIWSIIVTILFAECMVQTVEIEGVMDITLHEDSVLLNLVWIGLFLIICVGIGILNKKRQIKKILSDHVKVRALFITAIIVTVLLVALVMALQILPFSDCESCFSVAKNMLKGDYRDWHVDENSNAGYMFVFPFQITLVLFDMLLLVLFSDNAFIAFQIINIILFIASVFAMYRTYKYIFNDNYNELMAVSALLFFPFAAYTLYCYGTMIGFAFSMFAVMYMYIYFDKRKLRYLFLCAIMITASVLFKKNYIIIMVAIILFLIYDAIMQKTWKSILGTGMIFATYFFVLTSISNCVEKTIGTEVPKGIPMLGWIAMGMNDSVNMPGWFDGYQLWVYGKVDFDYDRSIEVYKDHIWYRAKQYVKRPRYFLHFYKDKIVTQWNNPTWEVFGILDQNNTRINNVWIKKEMRKPNRLKYMYILNIFNTIINAGLVLYTISCWKNFKKVDIKQLVYPVILIGGFLFFIMWEAKNQYCVPFYFVCVPYAVLGWGSFTKYILNKCRFV